MHSDRKRTVIAIATAARSLVLHLRQILPESLRWISDSSAAARALDSVVFSLARLERLFNPRKLRFDNPNRADISNLIPLRCPESTKHLRALFGYHNSLITTLCCMDCTYSDDPAFWSVQMRLSPGPNFEKLLDDMEVTVEQLHALATGTTSTSADQARSPATVTPDVQRVQRAFSISLGDNNFSLQEGDGQPVSVPDTYKAVFWWFVYKVHAGVPTEIVNWKDLNLAVGKDNSEPKVSDPLTRTILQRFNAFLKKNFGLPPDKRKWIVTRRSKGAYLNPTVNWQLSTKLRRLLSSTSVFDHAVDPGILAENQPNRGSKLASKSRRRKSDREDNE